MRRALHKIMVKRHCLSFVINHQTNYTSEATVEILVSEWTVPLTVPLLCSRVFIVVN